ncbi:MAG: hypothetical protein CMG64_07375 [Candidatus Marinimicrobia bacterium]|nr:hypothetical protein [Candidatus Neomarinimicrobiota bacterium]|tara:strand:+ start:2183 stop:2608 length:426 start_codon:yes stop_codon:yes gene_type:complete
MYNFTPQSAFIGGILIGVSALIFFYSTGRLAGVSGIFTNAFFAKEKKISNWLFLIGLVIGSLFYMNFSKAEIEFNVTNSLILVPAAGFLVGLGTRLGGGCTSGHGVCGISRFSFRSIVGTLIFISTGMITVFILQKYGFYL